MCFSGESCSTRYIKHLIFLDVKCEKCPYVCSSLRPRHFHETWNIGASCTVSWGQLKCAFLTLMQKEITSKLVPLFYTIILFLSVDKSDNTFHCSFCPCALVLFLSEKRRLFIEINTALCCWCTRHILKETCHNVVITFCLNKLISNILPNLFSYLTKHSFYIHKI